MFIPMGGGGMGGGMMGGMMGGGGGATPKYKREDEEIEQPYIIEEAQTPTAVGASMRAFTPIYDALMADAESQLLSPDEKARNQAPLRPEDYGTSYTQDIPMDLIKPQEEIAPVSIPTPSGGQATPKYTRQDVPMPQEQMTPFRSYLKYLNRGQ